tara:strand:+ start:462 stop:800 length:339 start_codon:yes stop_codon:yes gene_type:complete
VQPQDVLDFAYQIYKENDSEASYRTSVGRSYYSTFYPAKAVYEKLKLTGHGNTHEKVISGYEKKHPAIHSALGALFSDRVQADYHLSEKVTASHAKAALSKARKIQEKLGSL